MSASARPRKPTRRDLNSRARTETPPAYYVDNGTAGPDHRTGKGPSVPMLLGKTGPSERATILNTGPGTMRDRERRARPREAR